MVNPDKFEIVYIPYYLYASLRDRDNTLRELSSIINITSDMLNNINSKYNSNQEERNMYQDEASSKVIDKLSSLFSKYDLQLLATVNKYIQSKYPAIWSYFNFGYYLSRYYTGYVDTDKENILADINTILTNLKEWKDDDVVAVPGDTLLYDGKYNMSDNTNNNSKPYTFVVSENTLFVVFHYDFIDTVVYGRSSLVLEYTVDILNCLVKSYGEEVAYKQPLFTNFLTLVDKKHNKR